ncbi:MAG: transglutaminase domain-containing protein [Oscillospiraceae bacterium]|nr:transglutaminase domain-containing protein [Oscillospiraceae bacterium]
MTLTDKFKEAVRRSNEIIMPFLLCVIIISAALNIYTDNYFDIYTAVAAVWTAALFALFSKLRKIRFGGLIYTAILIVLGFVPNLLISSREDVFGFVQWFFSAAEAVKTRPSFALLLIIMLGFFFASTVFYFTQVIYRSAAVGLISLIPFALAVKTATNPPVFYIVAASALNLFLFVFYSRKELLKNAKKSVSPTLVVYGDFAVAAVLLAMLIPKPEETPFYEKFEVFTNVFQFGGSGETTYQGDYNKYSGTAEDLLRNESKLLYIVSTAEPTYMKAQVFDTYNKEEGRWESTVSMDGSKNWEDKASLLNYEMLAEDVSQAAANDPSLYEKYPFAKTFDSVQDMETYSVIYPRDFPAVYVLAPLRIKNANVSSTNASYTARSDKGEVFTNLRHLPPSAEYIVRYYSEDVFSFSLIGRGLCDITMDEYRDFLRDVVQNTDDAYSAADAFYSEYLKAEEYRRSAATEVSPEIQSLADSLTEGLEYDYQKAQAIEQYFHNNGFIYDLGYEVPDGTEDTPEFFIFESKTGICSDFATAYTLLARAAGLNVRYAEGFVPDQGETPQPGIYYIYTENAHAYPEVFIPGAGWMRFEPTIADNSGNSSTTGDGNDADSYLVFVFTAVIAVFVIGIFLLMFILTPKIAEALFRTRISASKDNDKAVRLIYLRHLKALGARYEIDPLPLTAEETAEATITNTGIPLDPVTEPFTALCYGGKPVSEDEKAAAFECYKAQAKEMKKKRKDQ